MRRSSSRDGSRRITACGFPIETGVTSRRSPPTSSALGLADLDLTEIDLDVHPVDAGRQRAVAEPKPRKCDAAPPREPQRGDARAVAGELGAWSRPGSRRRPRPRARARRRSRARRRRRPRGASRRACGPRRRRERLGELGPLDAADRCYRARATSRIASATSVGRPREPACIDHDDARDPAHPLALVRGVAARPRDDSLAGLVRRKLRDLAQPERLLGGPRDRGRSGAPSAPPRRRPGGTSRPSAPRSGARAPPSATSRPTTSVGRLVSSDQSRSQPGASDAPASASSSARTTRRRSFGCTSAPRPGRGARAPRSAACRILVVRRLPARARARRAEPEAGRGRRAQPGDRARCRRRRPRCRWPRRARRSRRAREP